MYRNVFTRHCATVVLFLGLAALLPMPALAQVAEYGKPFNGKYESYISGNGTQYKISDTLKLGVPQGGNKTFTYVNQHVGGMLLGTSSPCPSACSGQEYKIAGFKSARNQMWAKMDSLQRFTAPITVNFENALQSGELIGRGYTSDQALQELKKWKDKLDLELITKEEYEAKKQELSKYIH